MTVVHAFKNYTGCRNVTVSRVVKRLVSWERNHNCRIDVIYVNTLQNWADEPRFFPSILIYGVFFHNFSRIVPSDEVSVHRRFIARVENDFDLQITYDVCGHRGVQIVTEDGRSIPYCSRFADGRQAHLNFLSNIFYLTLNSMFMCLWHLL